MVLRRFDTLMRYNTPIVKPDTCCLDYFSHRLRSGVHYRVRVALWSPGL